MKINDVITENTDAASSAYQQMMRFAAANKLPGIPPDQQIALALFQELQKQKAQNNQLGAELADAEERIDVATSSGKMYKQELGQHRTELDRERGEIEQQRGAMSQMDKAAAEREQASAEQIQQLTARLETIKSKPGVNDKMAKQLEQQIQDLEKKGVDSSQVQALERKMAQVQQMHQVDADAINTLVSQINDAEKVKKELGRNLETTSKNVNDQIAQIQKQLAHVKDVEQTVAAINDNLADINQDFDMTSRAVVDLDLKTKEIDKKVSDIGTAYGQRAVANDTAKMIRQQQAAAAQRNPAFDPRVTAQRLVDKGVLQSVDEQQMFRAINWATGIKK